MRIFCCSCAACCATIRALSIYVTSFGCPQPVSFASCSQAYLQKYEGTVVVVAHDRAFLDAVATDIIHFHHRQKKLIYHVGMSVRCNCVFVLGFE